MKEKKKEREREKINCQLPSSIVSSCFYCYYKYISTITNVAGGRVVVVKVDSIVTVTEHVWVFCDYYNLHFLV